MVKGGRVSFSDWWKRAAWATQRPEPYNHVFRQAKFYMGRLGSTESMPVDCNRIVPGPRIAVSVPINERGLLFLTPVLVPSTGPGSSPLTTSA